MERFIQVATVLTVYGIETLHISSFCCKGCREVATVLTVYGIETLPLALNMPVSTVATVLTVYGIETCSKHPTRRFVFLISRNSTYRLRY